MSLATHFPPALLETILTRLAPLFLAAGNDITAPRQAAAELLGAYQPETSDELRLAANIIAFSFQALEALSQAAAPEIPLTRILRLRGSAVSLSRESTKAQRHLDQLQKARQQNLPTQPIEVQPAPNALDEDTGNIAAAKANRLTWTATYEQRQRDKRIAASLQRAEIRVAAQACPTMPDVIPSPSAGTTQPAEHATSGRM